MLKTPTMNFNALTRCSPLLAVFTLALPAPVHPQAAPPTITVSAAASLRDVLTEISQKTPRRSYRIRFNFGSSGALQRQIEEGARVDVFISAADRNMNELAAKNLILRGSRRRIAGNRLVLIVPADSRTNIRSFRDVVGPQVRYTAIAGPQAPAGVRAQELFTRLGIWPAVQRRAVRGKDVREVLTQVARGNVDAGVVYQSDAASSREVRVVATAPAALHGPIRYPAAVVSRSARPQQAGAFVQFLGSREAREILRRHRFIVPAAASVKGSLKAPGLVRK